MTGFLDRTSVMRALAQRIIAGAIATALVSVTGCMREERDPLRLVIAVDASASIERLSEEQAFDSIERSMRLLGRGDSVVIVPITGDAWNDSQRAIIRDHLSEERQPYDEDLRRFAGRVRNALEAMRRGAVKDPAQSTDILGTVDVAAEEASRGTPGLTRAILIISDFIQDDGQFNFKTDPRLANPRRARQLAAKLAEAAGPHLQGVKVYLGYLASVDGRRLSSARREGIEAFWTTYLTRQGAEVEWAIDGSGRLPQFLAGLREHAVPTLPALARLFGDLRPRRLDKRPAADGSVLEPNARKMVAGSKKAEKPSITGPCLKHLTAKF
jgi:hypothetical protein